MVGGVSETCWGSKIWVNGRGYKFRGIIKSGRGISKESFLMFSYYFHLQFLSQYEIEN